MTIELRDKNLKMEIKLLLLKYFQQKEEYGQKIKDEMQALTELEKGENARWGATLLIPQRKIIVRVSRHAKYTPVTRTLTNCHC